MNDSKDDILGEDITEKDVLEENSGLFLNGTSEDVTTNISDVIGGHGPWQFRHWIVFFTASACNSLHLFSVFAVSSTSFCYPTNTTGKISNTTLLPLITNCSSTDCKNPVGYTHFARNDIPGNKSYEEIISYSDQDSSHCDDSWIATSAKCIYAMGILLSGLIIRPLMHRFSRRQVSLTSCVILLVSSIATSWAKTPAIFLVLRFLLSIGMVNIYLISAFSLMECLHDGYKLLYGLTGHLAWNLGNLMLPLMIWLARDWTRFNMIISIPCFLLFLILCFLPESPVSYAVKGDWSHANKTLRLAALSNGYPAWRVDRFTRNLVLKEQNEIKDTFKICKRKNSMEVVKLILVFLSSFMVSFLYFTSIWLTVRFKEDWGTYFALVCSAEVAATIILLFLTCFISLHHLWAFTSAVASVILLVLYAKANHGYAGFSAKIYICTVFFTSAAWTSVLLRFLGQPIRSALSKWNAVAVGVAMAFGCVAASLVDSQVFYEWGPEPLLIFGIPHLIISAFVILIPDKRPVVGPPYLFPDKMSN